MENKELFIKNKTKMSKSELLEEYFLIASSNEEFQKSNTSLEKELNEKKELLSEEIKESKSKEDEIKKLLIFEKGYEEAKVLEEKLRQEKNKLKEDLQKLAEENKAFRSEDRELIMKEKEEIIEKLSSQCQELGNELSKIIDAWELSLKLMQSSNDLAVNNFGNLKENIIKKWGNK